MRLARQLQDLLSRAPEMHFLAGFFGPAANLRLFSGHFVDNRASIADNFSKNSRRSASASQPELLPNPFTAEELPTRVRRLLEEHSN